MVSNGRQQHAATPATTAGKTTGRRILEGIVTRDKMAKTRRVEVERLVRHAKYGKYVKRRTVCYAHDEKNESHLGDTVEIIESRPLSKLKRWELVQGGQEGPEPDAVEPGRRGRRSDAAATAAARRRKKRSDRFQICDLRLSIDGRSHAPLNRRLQS